jgi:hypothetical protein
MAFYDTCTGRRSLYADAKQQALTEPYHQAREAAAAFPATFLQGSAGELREKGKIS